MDKQYPLVYVVWEDTVRHGGWHTPDSVVQSVKEDFLVGSAGLLVAKGKKKVAISHGRSLGNGDFQDLLVIPRANVRSITKMKVVTHGKTRSQAQKKH